MRNKLKKSKMFKKIIFGTGTLLLVGVLGWSGFIWAQNYITRQVADLDNLNYDQVQVIYDELEYPEQDVFSATKELDLSENEIEILSLADLVMPAMANLDDGFGWYKDEDLGYWRFNPGVTFMNESSMPVNAALPGKVESIEWDHNSNSYNVVMKNSETLTTVYSHLKDLRIIEGDDVIINDVIAYAAGDGPTYFVFEIYENGKPVDPSTILQDISG